MDGTSPSKNTFDAFGEILDDFVKLKLLHTIGKNRGPKSWDEVVTALMKNFGSC